MDKLPFVVAVFAAKNVLINSFFDTFSFVFSVYNVHALILYGRLRVYGFLGCLLDKTKK